MSLAPKVSPAAEERLVVMVPTRIGPPKVDEAVETKPLLNSRVVEVAFSPVAKVLNG